MQQRLAVIRQNILEACHKAGRDASEVSLLPVSKTFDDASVLEAAGLGLKRFGENRLPDIRKRCENLADHDFEWVMIGHAQSNKARDIARYVTELQSLDRASLAEALDKRLEVEGRTIDVLIQLKTAAEDSKTGLEPAELVDFLQRLNAYPSLKVKGVMTMATQTTDEAEVRRCFKVAREARQRALEAGYPVHRLSMGMSQDYALAIAEGSTELRIGSALFGHRDYT